MTKPLDLDELDAIARAATPGEWEWFGNMKTREVSLATVRGGRRVVMDFERWGMRSAQPRFQLATDGRAAGFGRMADLEDLGDLGPRIVAPHRHDFIGIVHPNARHIARFSPDVVRAVIDRARAAEVLAAAALEWRNDMMGSGAMCAAVEDYVERRGKSGAR